MHLYARKRGIGKAMCEGTQLARTDEGAALCGYLVSATKIKMKLIKNGKQQMKVSSVVVLSRVHRVLVHPFIERPSVT